MNDSEDLYRWERPGYPHALWHEALSRAIRQRLDAVVALRDFYEREEAVGKTWLDQRRLLAEQLETTDERERAAFLGDAQVIAELLDGLDANQATRGESGFPR